MMQVEEAAAVAQEFISSLDNLPAEIQHLLAEIRDRENKIQELLHSMQTKTQSYIRNMISGQALSAKDAAVPNKCTDEWLRVEQLADEKVVFANRIVELLTKASGRLDADLGRIVQPGFIDFQPAPTELAGSMLFGRNSGLDDMHKNLRGALGTPDGSPPNMLSAPPTKRRRLTQATSSHPSPSPSAPAARDRGRARGRGSHLVDAMEEDAEEEVVENDEGDDTLYCFCQKPSYDEMIACDAENCPYEWFHVTCVNMVGQNPDTWYCPECAPKMEGEKRKGRRK